MSDIEYIPCTIIGGPLDGQTGEVAKGERGVLIPNDTVPDTAEAAMLEDFVHETFESALNALMAWGKTMDEYLVIPRESGAVAFRDDEAVPAPPELITEWEQHWNIDIKTGNEK